MSTIEVDERFAQQTVDDLRIALATLERERDDLTAKIAATTDRIANWEKRIGRASSVKKPRAPRRKKGQNRTDILALFQSSPGQGMTMTAIAEATSIPWSSTRNVLKKYDTLFREDELSSLWYLRRNGHAEESRAGDAASAPQ